MASQLGTEPTRNKTVVRAAKIRHTSARSPVEFERQRAVEALKQSEERYRLIAENMTDMVWVIDMDLNLIYASPSVERARGYTFDELRALPLEKHFTPESLEAALRILDEALALDSLPSAEGIRPQSVELESVRKDGSTFWSETRFTFLRDANGKPTGVLSISRDITERKKVEQEIQRRAAQLETLNEIARAVSSLQDRDAILQVIYAQVQRIIPLDAFYIALYDASKNHISYPLMYDEGQRYMEPPTEMHQGTALEKTILTGIPRLVNRAAEELEPVTLPERSLGNAQRKSASLLFAPLKLGANVIGVISAQSYTLYAYTEEHLSLLMGVAHHAVIAIENARLFEEEHQRVAELEAVNRISTALRASQSLNEMLPRLMDETLAILGTDAGIIWLDVARRNELHSAVARGWFTEIVEAPVQPGEGIAGHVFATGQAHRSSEFVSDPLARESTRPQIPAGWGGACVPIRTAQEIVGVMFVSVQHPRELTPAEVALLTTLAEIAGNAIHRMRLHEQTEERLQRLSALRTVDAAISSSFDVKISLNVLLEQVLTQLHVDAAAVYLLNRFTQTLEYAAGRGFRTNAVESLRFRLGEGIMGRAALEHRMINLPHLADQAEILAQNPFLTTESFASYFSAPLIAKGELKGILQAFCRSPLVPDPDWFNFLDMLATQAAIAIDSVQVFEGLQRSKIELALAYDKTLEGWSRALDLRGGETEGHAHRVAEMTVRLARSMGVNEADLMHIRRGALLHDIGEMGMPDAILLKPGTLTEEEWHVMHHHPTYAYELLSPITYLRPALDIPYAHHEKWDGTGYPRGLRGEQIPLAARIFAIVDVWDTLLSDRLYQRKWNEKRIRIYLRDESGKHFDPKVVEAFLELDWPGQ